MTSDGRTRRLVITWLPTSAVSPSTLARLVADSAGTASDDIRVVHACRSCGSDQHGKPHVVVGAGATPQYLSLSRSGGRAVVAVTDVGPVGVDIETIESSDHDLTTWVRTESLVKATGHGVTIDPDLVDGGPTWTVDLDGPPGFVAAATVLTATPLLVVTTWAAPEG